MKTLLRHALGPAGTFVMVATERSDGDLHPGHLRPQDLTARQRALTGRRWAMVDQVHGTAVHRARPDDPDDTEPVAADVVVSGPGGPAVAVWAADCAPLFLVGASGTVVGVHAGWRGLAAGIVDVAVRELARIDGSPVAAAVGPAVGPCCYPFGDHDRRRVADGVGVPLSRITGRATTGEPSLDVGAAVAGALERHGVGLDVVGPCTRCDRRWFSHRGGDTARHAVVGWTEAVGGG